VEEWLLSAELAMYEGPQSGRTPEGDSRAFDAWVGLHQGSILNPCLFVIVMEAITKKIWVRLPWQLTYADDLIVRR